MAAIGGLAVDNLRTKERILYGIVLSVIAIFSRTHKNAYASSRCGLLCKQTQLVYSSTVSMILTLNKFEWNGAL